MLKATQAGAALAAPEVGPIRLHAPLPAAAFSAPPVSLVSPVSAVPAMLVAARTDWMPERVRDRVLAGDVEFGKYGPADTPTTAALQGPGLFNYLFASEDQPHEPDAVFARLRWGGQFVYTSRDAKKVSALAQRFQQRGYELIRGPAVARAKWLGLLGLGRRVHYFIARKVRLTLPREISERFTYTVKLVTDHPSTSDYIVLKEVPSVERVSARLRHKFPDAAPELIEKRARKFTEKIFPLFLTREAAMLKILERDLPKDYGGRVPRVIDLEQDNRGYVRRMWMNWLRAAPPGGKILSQFEFARQATELLSVVHDKAGIIHLDLRLDNVVITEQGVGFVDFGSAVRVGENIQGNPLLATIFDELMRTSQIQRMLERMTLNGTVTSPVLNDAYGKVDKGVDLFYLAVQINSPVSNPDFVGLVEMEPGNAEARGLAAVTQDVLKPADPNNPTIKCARDLLASIDRLGRRLGRSKG